jgi:hypothetical protein
MKDGEFREGQISCKEGRISWKEGRKEGSNEGNGTEQKKMKE